MAKVINISEGRSYEQLKTEALIQSLANFFRKCVAQKQDNTDAEVILWLAYNLPQEKKPQDMLYELYKADPNNIEVNINKFLKSINAGNGLYQLMRIWMPGISKYEKEA